MKGFTEEFAARGGKSREELYYRLSADMSPYFRERMDKALPTWEM
jgi:hypothetical protein